MPELYGIKVLVKAAKEFRRKFPGDAPVPRLRIGNTERVGYSPAIRNIQALGKQD